MSVVAGRVFLSISGVVFAACLVWLSLGVRAPDLWSGFFALSAVGGGVIVGIGIVAAVAFLTGAALLGRFVESDVDGGRLVIRYVMRPRRFVELAELDEIVVLRSVSLPSRAGSDVQRVILRRENRTVLAFTPHKPDAVSALSASGVPMTVIHEPLTPVQVARRWGRAIGLGEWLTWPIMWAAVVVPVVILILLVVDAAGE